MYIYKNINIYIYIIYIYEYEYMNVTKTNPANKPVLISFAWLKN